MSELRCGVAGLGRGRMFVEILDALPDCRVTAVCDTDPAKLAGLDGPTAHTDYDAFLADRLDLVAVVTPGPMHAGQSVAALASGAHVLCETPCVYSVAEARAVLAAARAAGRRFMLAEDYIWSGFSERLKAVAAGGGFGEIVYAEGDYTHDCRDLFLADAAGFVPYAKRASRPAAKKTWRATHLPPIVYCSHTLGPLLHWMDDRVVSVIGLSTGPRTAPELGTIDVEAALLTTARGAILRLTNGFSAACPYRLVYNLVGTSGSAMLVNDGQLTARWFSESADPPTAGWCDLPGDLTGRADGRSPVAAMIGEFVESIRRDAPPPLDAVRSMELVLPGVIAHESALAGGVKMDVPDLRDETSAELPKR